MSSRSEYFFTSESVSEGHRRLTAAAALRRDGARQIGRGCQMSSRSDYFFTSESVSEGHPDKVCDRISDAVLDAFLAEDPEARVACETFATTDRVVVGGEVRGPGEVLERVEEIVRDCVQGHRLRAEGLQLGQPARPQLHPRPVRAHRPGRRRRRGQGGGRGRPGDHVRLRRRRDARADAGADPLCPRGAAPARRGAQERRRAAARAGRQGAAVAALRRRQAGRGLVPRALDPASRREHGVGGRARDGRALHPRGAPRGLADRRTPSGTSTRPASS